ncbi:unnamed protein product [Closterium sp. NIES-65]|nr:unnamed protein product [Closterium sp. NIES-65]CAI6012378.1 unnamed protein product [Closterium sp. NIES-65]
MAVIGERRAKFSAAGLLPLLVLALLLQAPSASARRWFWNDALFPVGSTGETNPAAALAAAESSGSATAAESAPVVPTPAPVAPAPAPTAAPAVSCYDAVPVDPFVLSGAAPDPCAKLAAELKRSAGKLAGKTGGVGFAAPSLFRACHSTFLFRKDCDVGDLLSIGNAFDNHYVYKHIAMDSPDQTNLPSSVDILAEMRKIVLKALDGKYARLVDAHMAAYRAINSLNDGHTLFIPQCFLGEFNLPLPLMAVVENGQQIIRVSPRRYVTPSGTDHVAKVLHNFDFGLYEGRQVFLVGGNTAVIWIHQFSPIAAVTQELAANNIDMEKFMILQVTKALNTAAASGASQIIIDVRGNGGGSTVAAFTAIRLLMGADKVPDSDFAMPMDLVIGTEYTESAINVLSIDPATHYYFKAYADLNGTDFSSGFDYAPFRKLRFTKKGPAGNYSARFKAKHQFAGNQTQPIFGDRPFMVLSDGNCFSACAILTHVLGKRHKVPMVTVGGLPNQPPDVGSSCLGFTLPDVYSMAPGLRNLAALEPMNSPPPLKVKGSVGMAFTNGYVDSEIPCEFEFLPSQHHINYTVDLIDKPWAMWSEVAKLFASPAA